MKRFVLLPLVPEAFEFGDVWSFDLVQSFVAVQLPLWPQLKYIKEQLNFVFAPSSVVYKCTMT